LKTKMAGGAPAMAAVTRWSGSAQPLEILKNCAHFKNRPK
jgi:hypothetical protein